MKIRKELLDEVANLVQAGRLKDAQVLSAYIKLVEEIFKT